MSSNKLVGCPYDEAHKVKESRLSLHITKCRLNHLDEEKFICPFNATHVLPYQERDYHVSHCLDRAPLDRKMVAQSMDKNNPFKGNTSVPSYTMSAPTVTDEVWDEEYCVKTSKYDADHPPPCAIIEPKPMSRPAERRKLYQDLHRMPTELERISDQSSDAPSKESGVQQNRQPKAPSQAENKKNVQEFHNLGLGRGKPVATSRIAANIFSPQAEPKANSSIGVNYSAALTSGMSNLGLGRGFVANTANDNVYDEDQFPALGCGRGIFRPAKNGTRYPGSRS